MSTELMKQDDGEKIVNVNEESEDNCSNAKKQKLDEPATDKAISTEAEPAKLLKKRKYALLLGYSGEGYYGLQRSVFASYFLRKKLI